MARQSAHHCRASFSSGALTGGTMSSATVFTVVKSSFAKVPTRNIEVGVVVMRSAVFAAYKGVAHTITLKATYRSICMLAPFNYRVPRAHGTLSVSILLKALRSTVLNGGPSAGKPNR